LARDQITSSRTEFQISETLTTRNQLKGTVASVATGPVMAEVEIDAGGQSFVAAITRHSVDRLGLSKGDSVTVPIKATEVMLAKGSSGCEESTTRNQIKGKVKRVETGEVMAEVQIETAGGELVAAVTKHSAERLGLAPGDDVVALVKATEVMLAK
jgi:molybdate transport system regulatory protein